MPDDVVVRDYPALLAVNPHFKGDHHEKTFVLGLDMLLDGAQEMIRRKTTNSPGDVKRKAR